MEGGFYFDLDYIRTSNIVLLSSTMSDFGIVLTVSGIRYKLPDDCESKYAIHIPIDEVNRTVTISCDDPMDGLDLIVVNSYSVPHIVGEVFNKRQDIRATFTLPEKSMSYTVIIQWHDERNTKRARIPLFFNCSKDHTEHKEHLDRYKDWQSISTLEQIER